MEKEQNIADDDQAAADGQETPRAVSDSAPHSERGHVAYENDRQDRVPHVGESATEVDRVIKDIGRQDAGEDDDGDRDRDDYAVDGGFSSPSGVAMAVGADEKPDAGDDADVPDIPTGIGGRWERRLLTRNRSMNASCQNGGEERADADEECNPGTPDLAVELWQADPGRSDVAASPSEVEGRRERGKDDGRDGRRCGN